MGAIDVIGRWLLMLFATGCLAGPAIAVQSPPIDPDAHVAAIRLLRKATVSQRDGRHLLLLSSLRQLHDPSMRALFERLIEHGEWQVQVHAVLALSRTGPSPHLDPSLVMRVDPYAQESIVTTAMDMDLLGLERIHELLEWEGLEDMPRLLLLAELMLLGESPDSDALRRLSESANFPLAGLASCVIAELGDPGVFSAYSDRLAGLPAATRRRHVAWLIEAIRQYRLKAAAPWVARQLDDPDVADAVSAGAIVTLLQLDSPQGIAAWTRRLGPEPTHVEQVSMGLLLLESDDPSAAAEFDRLTGNDPLIGAMADAGKARAAGVDPTDSLIRLADLGHMRSSAWVMRRAEELPPAAAARLYGHLIDHVEDHRHARSEWVDMAVSATSRLFKIDPDAVERRLADAVDDSLRQQTILLGLLAANSPRIAQAAGRVRRLGAGQADSLALLLIAKLDNDLSAEDLAQLALIVRGGGRVSEVLQVQAAWLYLRHTGVSALALDEIFADTDG